MWVFAQIRFIGYLFLAAVVVWVFVTVKRGQHRLARQNARRRALDSPLEEPPESPYPRGLPDSTVRRQVEVHETVRELLVQLDSKIGALEQWIREADRVAARFESALAAARPEILRPAVPDRSSEAASDAAHEPYAAPPGSQADALRSAGVTGVKPKPDVYEDTMVAARPASDRRYEEIYALADYGLEPAEIAQRVGSPVGEVQLILSLRGKR